MGDPTRQHPQHQDLFQASTPSGHVVALRIPDPGDLTCARLRWAEALSEQTGEVTELEDITFSAADIEMPEWLRFDPQCAEREDDSQDCTCGLVSLVEACEDLDDTQRSAALIAHLKSMGHLDAHRLACASILEPTDAQTLENACPECLTEPLEHSAEMAEAADTKVRELLEFLRTYRTWIEVKGATQPETE
jgi:hypothetical protein